MAHAIPFIAVVDDESPVRNMLGRVLRLAGWEVGSYASGEEFLASLPLQQPSCVILDINMPGLSGFGVHSFLLAKRIPIPVVFITASDEASLDGSARQAGAVRLLRKPFSSNELLEAVGTALQALPDQN